jgi:hypothetical protein
MGIGRDSANFAKRGIINFISFIFFLALFVGILYYGYKFLVATYGINHPYMTLIIGGLLLGDILFCTTLGKYIDEILLKKK